MTNFRITDCKGFGMSFANGWGISVQWGYGNYCSNYSERQQGGESYSDLNRRCGEQGSTTAEVAVFNPKGEMVKLPAFMYEGGEESRDIVAGYCRSAKVLELMNWVAAQEAA